jgi:hypothetical protein
MALKMSEFHGIDSKHVAALQGAGIADTDDLMKLWSDKDKRGALVTSTGIAETDFMRFAAMARLGRVKGMALQHLDVLVAADIDGPKRLFTYTPESLAKHLAQVAADKKLTVALPTLKEIASWFAGSKTNGDKPSGPKSDVPRSTENVATK